MEVEDDASKPSLASMYEALQALHAKGAISTHTLTAAYGAKPPTPPAALGGPKDDKDVPKIEPAFAEPKLDTEVLENPCRVLRSQERVIGALAGSRYVPISTGRKAGIIVLKDTTPGEAEDLLVATAIAAATG